VNKVIRLYQEYSRFGDLNRLPNQYKYWDTYTLELFLCHLLLGLARAVDLMRRCPRHWQPTLLDPQHETTRLESATREDYLLHLDLKPSNVVLGDLQLVKNENGAAPRHQRHRTDGRAEQDTSGQDLSAQKGRLRESGPGNPSGSQSNDQSHEPTGSSSSSGRSDGSGITLGSQDTEGPTASSSCLERTSSQERCGT
jgi:hypothetical protein